VPSCLPEPIWVEFRALRGAGRPPFDPGHPLGCHRRRVPDRVVLEHVVAALVHGSGHERIAIAGCSDRTIRRRLKDWAEQGLGQRVHARALAAYDQVIGLELAGVAVEGCMTKAPWGAADRALSGGPAQGRPETPAGHRRPRHPAGIAAAGAPRHDSPLLAPAPGAAAGQLGGPRPEQPTCHLAAGYDGQPARRASANWALPARSPARAWPLPSRPGNAGPWSEHTPG